MIFSELLESARTLGIEQGATVYVASNIARFGLPAGAREMIRSEGPDALLRSHVDTLREIVGIRGTLVMPTFSYSACNDEIYDPQVTPSVVGSLTDYFWRQHGVERSHHPIFSAAAVGPQAGWLLRTDNPDCFGTDSLFGKLCQADATYLMYGVNMWEGSSYVYYSEQCASVPYRYMKQFRGRIRHPDGTITEQTVPYFVRDLQRPYRDAWRPLQADSIAACVTRAAGSAQAPLLAHNAKAIDAFIRDRLAEEADYLIELT